MKGLALTASWANDLAVLKTASAEALRCCDADGQSPLHFAASANHADCVSWLLRTTPALGDAKDSQGTAALHTAATFGSRECALLLLSHGVAVDLPDGQGRTPLSLACAAGQLDTAMLFLDRQANVRARDSHGRVPLHYAAQAGSTELVKLLLSQAPDMACAADLESVYALHLACLSASVPCARILLDRGDAKGLVDGSGASALHYAAAGGSVELMQALLDGGASALVIDSSGNTPLHYSARSGHAELAAVLLGSVGPGGAVMPNVSGDTPAHLAAFGGHVNVLQLMEGRFPKPVEGMDTLLQKASFGGHGMCVAYLLSLADQSQCQPNARGSHQGSVLHKAAAGGSEQCVKLLLAAGADVWATDGEEALPLHKACFGGHTEAVALLYAQMENPTESPLDSRQHSALHMAASSGDAACLAFCLAHFKDSESGDGFFCAHYAALHGDAAVVETLHTADSALLAKLTRDGRSVAQVAEGNEAFVAALARLESNSNASAVAASPVSADLRPIAASRSMPNDMLNRAVALFNAKPKKGVEFVIQQRIIPSDDPDAIAKFLFETDALSKKKIGELITENDEWSQSLANAFLRQLDFAERDFDTAIRQFLSKFMLPGEAQKIDRVMEMFASRYHGQNPKSIFANADTCYVLAFAVIMLNTDLFNPSIKKEKKMSKQQWVSHVRGINDGQDLPLEFVHETYERIRVQEIKMESETNMFANAGKKGFCMKQGGKIRTWKRRYFILSDHQLFYFRSATDEGPLGIIPLENLTVVKEEKAVKNGFRLVSTDGEIIKSVRMTKGGAPKKGNHLFYIIGASTAEEQEEWIDALNQAIHRSPFYNLLLAKKKN